MRRPAATLAVITGLVAVCLVCAHACEPDDARIIQFRCPREVIAFLDALRDSDFDRQCFALDGYLGCVFHARPDCVGVVYDAITDRKHVLRGCDSQFLVSRPTVPHWRRGFS